MTAPSGFPVIAIQWVPWSGGFCVDRRWLGDGGRLRSLSARYGSLALAASRGNAAQLLRVAEGSEIVLDLTAR